MKNTITIDEWQKALDNRGPANKNGVATCELATKWSLSMRATRERLGILIRSGKAVMCGWKAITAINGRTMQVPCYKLVK